MCNQHGSDQCHQCGPLSAANATVRYRCNYDENDIFYIFGSKQGYLPALAHPREEDNFWIDQCIWDHLEPNGVLPFPPIIYQSEQPFVDFHSRRVDHFFTAYKQT